MWDKVVEIYNSHWLISHVALPLLIIMFGYLFSKMFDGFVLSLMRKYTKKTKTKLDDHILSAIEKPLQRSLFVLSIYIAVNMIPNDSNFKNILESFVFVLLVYYVTLFIVKIFRAFTGWYGKVMAPRTESDFDNEFIPIFEKIGTFVLYVLGLIWILDSLNINVSGPIMTLGVGGLAIGMAAREALSNMIAGFMLMIDRPFRIGDRVELEDGKIGDVVHLGVRSTRIKTFENKIIIIPNNQLLSNQVTNHTYPDTKIRRQIDVGVAYGTDLSRAMELMVKVCKQHDEVLDDPETEAYVISFGDSAVNLSCRFWVDDYRKGFALQSHLTNEVYKVFAKEGIEIPFPIRTIQMSREARELLNEIKNERKK